MSEDHDQSKEIERLKSEVLYERVRAQNLADRARTEYEAQKSKSTEILAIVSVLLICSLIILFSVK